MSCLSENSSMRARALEVCCKGSVIVCVSILTRRALPDKLPAGAKMLVMVCSTSFAALSIHSSHVERFLAAPLPDKGSYADVVKAVFRVEEPAVSDTEEEKLRVAAKRLMKAPPSPPRTVREADVSAAQIDLWAKGLNFADNPIKHWPNERQAEFLYAMQGQTSWQLTGWSPPLVLAIRLWANTWRAFQRAPRSSLS
jgi:hypothetical protein